MGKGILFKIQLKHYKNFIASPHSDRIYRISEKLNGIQLGVEYDKQGKYEQLDGKLKVLFEQHEEFQEAMAKKFSILRENVHKFLQFSIY